MLKNPVIAETLLRQYYAPGTNTNKDGAVKDAFIYLYTHDLIDRSDHVAAVTKKGEFFIEHILAVPFPVSIEAFKAALPTTLSIPTAQIELAQGERYAGLILGADGKPTHHLVLLPGDAEDLDWQQAVDWAEKQGGTLPTRAEQSLLFANLKGEFQPAYYWSGQQHKTNFGWAWCQDFSYGYQDYSIKSLEFRARAVRRLVIE